MRTAKGLAVNQTSVEGRLLAGGQDSERFDKAWISGGNA